VEGNKHKHLKKVAIGWLANKIKCTIFAEELEIYPKDPDAYGIKSNDDCYYIECKATQEDLMGGLQRKFNKNLFELKMTKHRFIADFFYFVLADGLDIKDKYPHWGIINEHGEVVRRAKRIPRCDEQQNYPYLDQNPEKLRKQIGSVCCRRLYRDLIIF